MSTMKKKDLDFDSLKSLNTVSTSPLEGNFNRSKHVSRCLQKWLSICERPEKYGGCGKVLRLKSASFFRVILTCG